MCQDGLGRVIRVYERFGVGMIAEGVGYGVDEWVKCDNLIWFGHVTRINEDDFVKQKMYEGKIEGRVSAEGRHCGRSTEWLSTGERAGGHRIEYADREKRNRENCRSPAVATPLGRVPAKGQGVRNR